MILDERCRNSSKRSSMLGLEKNELTEMNHQNDKPSI